MGYENNVSRGVQDSYLLYFLNDLQSRNISTRKERSKFTTEVNIG